MVSLLQGQDIKIEKGKAALWNNPSHAPFLSPQRKN